MKIKLDELGSTIKTATNSVVTSMMMFSVVLSTGSIQRYSVEMLCKELRNFQKTIDFANNMIQYLSESDQISIQENLDYIDDLIKENAEKISQVTIND